MPYTPNVPQALQRISATQQPILDNFIELDADFAINHITYTNVVGANRGKHTVSLYVDQGNPGAFAIGEAGIYNIGAELYIRKNADVNGIPFTQKTTPYVVPANGSLNYFYLPCGLQVKMGQVNTGMAQSVTIDMNGVGTNYAQVPYVYFSESDAALPGNISVLTSHTVGIRYFTIWSALQNVPVNWIAIGL
jgi:hypothetical protein